MKTLFFLISIFVAGIMSCNNPAKQAEQEATTRDTVNAGENKIQIPKSVCYRNMPGKDTVQLRLDIYDSIVAGNLVYNLFEKDRNKGQFEGRLNKDTLLADYTFESEGKQSVRQVIFLITDSTAVEGYGDMVEKNGKMSFRNASQANFGKGLILRKVSCND